MSAPASLSRPAAGREMAVTFDDLPVISVTRGDLASHREITVRLLDHIRFHGVPAVGFVNERKLMERGAVDEARVQLLRRWLAAGLELGNHTFGHLDLHRTPPARFTDDVVRGEAVTRVLAQEHGRALRYFRHPYLHTGTDLATRREVEEFLAGRGYRVAPVTVYTEDYLFAAAYDRAGQRGDHRMARRVAEAYVPYLESQVEYYERLSQRLLGYEVRQTLVLHANSINAEKFGELAHALKRRGYEFVTLERALADGAYAEPDTYVESEGISWLQRWALDRGHGESFLDGEPVTPWFVRMQAEVGRGARLMRWWNHWAHAAGRVSGALSSIGQVPAQRD